MLDNLISAVLIENSAATEKHPLHVLISNVAFFKFADNYSLKDNSFIGAITSEDDSFKNLFVLAHLLPLEVSETDSNILPLYVTQTFFQHYNFTAESRVFFKPVHCFPVSRIVFCARTVESYNWARHADWQVQLLTAACENLALCRLNDVILTSQHYIKSDDSKLLFDIIVAVCEPVKQGLITTETSITIAYINDNNVYSHLKNEAELSNRSISFEKQLSENWIEFDENSSEDEHCTKLKIVQSQSFHKMVSKINNSLDSLNTVIVSKEVFELLKISPGDYLSVSVPSTSKSRLAAVYPCSTNYEIGSSVYLSPCLLFNLLVHPTCITENGDTSLKVHANGNNRHVPPYATEVYVSLVQSPHYDATIDCNSLLKSHFSEKRYIMKGDIFGVDTKNVVNFQWKNDEADNIRRPVVYFRVAVIEGPFSNNGYFIDMENCKLYQSGTTQCFVPVISTNVVSHSLKITYFNSFTPSGLLHYLDQLVSLVLPVLKIWKKENFQKFRIGMNILLTGIRGCGKTILVKALCQKLSLHLYQVNCHELVRDSSATTEAQIKIVIKKASVYAPCIMLLENVDFMGKEKELKGENSRVLSSFSEHLRNVNPYGNEWPVVVIATTSDINLLSGELISSFLHHIHIDVPSEAERNNMLEHFLRPYLLHPNISVDYISQRTAGFVLGDLLALVNEALKIRYSRLKSTYSFQNDHFLEEDLVLSGTHVTQEDLVSALEKEQASKAERSGAPKIPSVSWEDVGGLGNAKQEILDTIQLPLKHPELLATGLRRSGMLLYGPPGTGKTLLAKAVATECSLNFLSVKGPELINMYVGQSEENVRSVFNQARSALPCIIFFDELDSLAPNRGRSGDSGGVTDRVVSQLLAELDGINNAAEVFVIGATNRPDLIDPALLRPGRFDRHVYVGVPSDLESRLSILKALTRKLPVSKDLDLMEIIDVCPPNLTGADFYSLCTSAMMCRIERNVKLVEKGKLNIKEAESTVTAEDFKTALKTFVPSLSVEEMNQYKFSNL